MELSAGDLEAADRHAQASIEHGAGIIYSQPLVAAYLIRHKVAEARGDLRGALLHYVSDAEAGKAYLNEVKTRELAYQIVKHETLQQTQQIAMLNQQNALLQLQQGVQEQSAQNSRLVMAMLLLMAFMGLWAYRTKRMQTSLRRMADDLRVRLAGIDTIESGHGFQVTASFGVTMSHLSGYDLTRLMSHADRALYRAKRGGRNRVRVFDGNIPADTKLAPAGGGKVEGEAESGTVVQLSAAHKVRNSGSS